MAKKDKKQKASRKKDGAKLSKDLRRTAETVAALAQNPIAREVAAAALAAGASALAKRGSLGKPVAGGESKIKAADIGALMAQGLAAFISGVGKPSAAPAADGKPADAAPHRQDVPRPKR